MVQEIIRFLYTLKSIISYSHLFEYGKNGQSWKRAIQDLYDPDNGDIYVANTFSHSVSVISGKTNTVIAEITVHSGETPRELAYDPTNHKLFVANVYSNTVSVINTTDNRLIDTIPAGSITGGVVYNSKNGDVYAINAGSPVTVINATSDKAFSQYSSRGKFS